jgi:uncharacterized protein YndB with AHSA1/START domain
MFLRAPKAKVWRAITNAEEFGSWFRVKLNGQFTPAARVEGKLLVPDYEHLKFELWVERIEPERLFSYRWHPYAIDPNVDYSNEPTTLVEFLLEDAEGGTKLVVVESGFEQIPLERRSVAFRMNEGGWAEQMDNVKRYVER